MAGRGSMQKPLSYSPCYCNASYTTNVFTRHFRKASAYKVEDPGSIPGSGRSSGEGNSNPLQYSCLENPWTEEPGRLQSVGLQSRTQLSNFTTTTKRVQMYLIWWGRDYLKLSADSKHLCPWGCSYTATSCECFQPTLSPTHPHQQKKAMREYGK